LNFRKHQTRSLQNPVAVTCCREALQEFYGFGSAAKISQIGHPGIRMPPIFSRFSRRQFLTAIGSVTFVLRLPPHVAAIETNESGIGSGVANMKTDGLVTLQSNFGYAETANRLVAIIRSKGVTIFAQIDHSDGAKAAGLELRGTLLIVFGNAKSGTPLTQIDQSLGLDLSLKVLIREDETGEVWLNHRKITRLAMRESPPGNLAAIATKLGLVIFDVANTTVGLAR
jgi:uncharacterized protein (DUF302 family)